MMFLHIIINIVIFVIIIILSHYLWEYCKDAFSKKKTKDLVNTQIDKYRKIIDEIHRSPSSNTQNEKQRQKQIQNDDLVEFINSHIVDGHIDINIREPI